MKFIPFCYFKPLSEQKLQEVNTYTDERYLSDNSSEQGNVLVLSKTKRLFYLHIVFSKRTLSMSYIITAQFLS